MYSVTEIDWCCRGKCHLCLFTIGPLLLCHKISTIIHGVISSILHSHLNFHRNFLNLGGGVKRLYNLLCILGAILFQTHPLLFPVLWVTVIGWNPRCFYTYPSKMNPKYTFLLSHPTPIYTSFHPTCLVQQLQYNFFQSVHFVFASTLNTSWWGNKPFLQAKLKE